MERILAISPDLPQGLILRSLIAAAEGKLVDAIADMEAVLEKDPSNVSWRLQLASYYHPRQAAAESHRDLHEDPGRRRRSRIARQARADTFLSIGKHAEAIADFEIALKAEAGRRRRPEQLRLGAGHVARRQGARTASGPSSWRPKPVS